MEFTWKQLCKAILMTDIEMADAVTIVDKYDEDPGILDHFPKVKENLQSILKRERRMKETNGSN